MNRRTIALLASAVIAFALAGYAKPRTTSAQSVPQVFFVDSVRARLAADWRDDDPEQRERAYCLTWMFTPASSRYQGVLVTGIRPADEMESDPESIVYECPRGVFTAALHTHGPNTCHDTFFGLACELGGIEANLCSPSATDVWSLTKTPEAFGIIQCAREALVPFWTARAYAIADSTFRASWNRRSH